jgi:hypothetical protein
MPFKNDYIMRLIEQLGLAWAEIVSLIRRGKYNEAEALISRTAQKLLGFDLGLLRGLSDEGIIELLRRPDASDVGQYLAAAELLAGQADIDERRRAPDAGYDCNHKALSLFLEAHVGAPDEWSDEYEVKVTDLLRRLASYPLPPALNRKLFHYHEVQRNYELAEDVLFRLGEAGDPQAGAAGAEFYARLREKSDAELEQGGLPRDEMEESALEFAELIA